MSLLLPNNPQSKLVSTKIASDISGYNSDYLARLCREEKIIGVNVGRAWIIDRESLEAFTAQQLEKKQIRAQELRAARGREYRIAQKPIAKAAQIATAAREALANRTASAAPTGTHQATPSPLSTPANVRAFSPPSPRVSSVGYSRPLAATAVALIVVVGSAYASTSPFALRAVALIPSAALALSNAASPTLLTASSFRVTDERALAVNENARANSFVFALPNARAPLAAFTDTTGTSASAVESYVHALGDNARAPFATTEDGMVAASRIAQLSNIAANPIGSLVNGYVYSGIYAYRASVAVRDGYVDGINESGDSALTVAAHMRDTLAFAPRITNGILDGYARGIFAWNDAAPKVAGTVVATVYDVGDVSGALALTAPTRVRALKDSLAMRAVDTSLALSDTVLEAEVIALQPLAPSSLARTQVEASNVSLGLVGKSAVRLNSLFAGFNETGTSIASVPLRAEGVLLGMAGYAGSVLDGTDSPAFEAKPDVSPEVLTAAAATDESGASSTTEEAASVDESRAVSDATASYAVASPADAESLSASVVSFAPVSWHRAFERIFHASSVRAMDLARTGMRAIANLLPGGIVAQPVLTIIDTSNETFLPLPPSDALTRTVGRNGNTSSNNSIVQNIFNSYFPQTILGGGASDELILAIVRPFVNASIESALRDNRRNNNDDNNNDSNDNNGGGGGVSSDGATLTNVNIQSGNATLSNVTANTANFGSTTTGTLTTGTTTVNGDLNVNGTITATTLSVSNLSSNAAVIAPFFTATSTTATSTFPNLSSTNAVIANLTTNNFGLGGDTFTSLLGTGLTNVGGVLTVSTSSLNLDGTYFKQGGNAYGAPAIIGTTDANPFRIIVNNAVAGTFDVNGFFGLGTTSPSERLAVAGNALISGGLTSGTLTTGSATVSSLSIGSLSGFLRATAGAVSVGLIDLSTDVSSTLPVSNGGTGSTSLGGILVGNGTSPLQSLIVSAPLSFGGNTLSINQAGAASDGYLSSADWNTFNTKFATTSTNYWLTTKSTSDLAEGSNLYYTDTRARNSFSFSGTGLTYSSGSGVLSVTGGYTIPVTASTTEWSSAYQNRITSATAPLSILNNVISIVQANATTSGFLSAADFITFNNKISSTSLSGGTGISYNSSTGVITNTGVTSNIAGAGINVSSATGAVTISNTGVLSAQQSFGGAQTGSITLASSTAGTDFSITNVGGIFSFNLPSASATNRGLLTAADFSTFSAKQAALTFTYPLVNSANTVSLAFGTTTANVWSQLQTFNGGITTAGTVTLGTLSGVLYGNNGVVNSTATSSVTNGAGISITGAASVVGAGGLTITNTGVTSVAQSFGSAQTGAITLASSTAGTDFSITNTGSTFSLNLPSASATNRGLLTAADFSTFNAKQAALTFTYPLVNSANTVSLAFGTTTANSWSALQTFNGGVTTNTLSIGSLSGVLYGNNGAITSSATSTPTLSSELTYSGTLGSFVGGTSGALSITTNGIALNKLVQVGANTILGNPTGASGNVQAFATSSLGIALSDTTGVLAQNRGGTGFSSYDVGDILYADASNNLQRLPIGGPGTVLKVQAGLPAWGVDQTVGGGGSDGIFATSSGKIYPLDTSNVLVLGSNSTTTNNAIFEVQGNSYFSGNVGIGTTSPGAKLAVTGNTLVNGNITATGSGTFGSLNVGTLNGILYGNNGAVAAASVTSPLIFSAGNLSITQANTSTNGFLSSTDFNTFNNKISSTSLSGVYPVQYNSSTGAISLAFGTTTSNTWAGTQTFTNAPILGSLTGLIYGNNGVLSTSGTSSLAISSAFNYSGVLGALVGGSSGTLSLATNGVALTNLAQIAANTILANPTGATGNVQAIATSTIFGTGIGGQVLTWNNGVPQWVASTTYANGTGISTSFANGQLTITNTGVTSVQQAFGSAQTGAITFASSTAGTDFSITNTGSTFSFNLPSASASSRGLLTAADFTTFNNKQAALTFTYPLVNSANTVSLAFGTTTANSWSALQTFNGGVTIGSLSGVLYGNNGSVTSTATSTATLGLGLSYSGTLGSFVGGVSGNLTVATSSLYSGTTGQFPYFSGTNMITATSSLFLAANGNVGVGTNNPTRRLTIDSGSPQEILLLQNTFGSVTHSIDTSGNTIILPGGTSKGISLFNSDSTGFITIRGSNGNVGVGTSSPFAKFSVAGNGFFDGSLTSTNLTATGTVVFTNIASGLVASNNGTLYSLATSTNFVTSLTAGTGIGLSGSTGAVTISNNGLLSLQQSFGSAQTGAITLASSTTGTDFSITNSGATFTLNLPSASATARGLLTSADWNTFNNKISSTSLSAVYPLAYNSSTGVFTTAFSTTTANTYSALQTFNGGVTTNSLSIGALSGVLYGNNGSVTSSATSTASLGLGLSYSGTLGSFVGGVSGNLTVATSSLYTGTTGQFPYFSATNTLTATSSLFLAANGNVGIGSTSPFAKLSVNGDLALTGGIYDNNATRGSNGQVLQTTGTGVQWVSTSTLGFPGGTVTSVNASGGTTGLTFSGGPITTSGTLTLSGTLGIVNGGTNNTAYTTNGVLFYDGTKLANGTGFQYDGTDATIVGGAFKAPQFLATDSAGAPGFSWANDTATGMYRQGANLIGFATGGVGRVFIDGNGFLGIGTTSPSQALSVAGNAYVTGSLASLSVSTGNLNATGTVTLSTLSGVLYGNNGVVNSTATSTVTTGTGISVTGTASVVGAGGLVITNTGVTSVQQAFGSVQTGAITLASSTTGTDFSITNTGSTFSFNLPSASATNRGLLTSTDWSTFNNKQAALTFTYPLVNSTNTVSLAFGTTTANSWSALQTFNGGITVTGNTVLGNATSTNAFITRLTANTASFGQTGSTTIAASGALSTPSITIGTLGGVLYGNNGAITSSATSTPTLSSELTYSGTLGSFVGGTSGALSITTNGIALNKLVQVGANTILGNPTGASGNVQAFATSSLGIAISDTTGTLTVARGGTGSTTLGGILIGNGTSAVGSATISAPLTYSGGTLAITQANTSTNGFLSSADFTIFNNKISSTSLSGGTGISYNSGTGVITNTGVTSNIAGTGISVSGATGAVTITNTGVTSITPQFGSAITGGVTVASSTTGTDFSITGSGATLTFNLPTASATNRGLLTAADFSTFSAKQSALTFTYPLVNSANTVSLAFGTTTANSWSAAQMFNGGVTTNSLSIGSLSGVLYGNNGAVTSSATSTATLGLGLGYSGTLGSFVGGTSGNLTIATSSLYSGTTGQFPYFSGTNTITATSSIFLATNGNVGIGTTSPYKKLSVTGDFALTGGFFDSAASAGTNGFVLQSTGSATRWVATSTLGFSSAAGTTNQVAYFNGANSLTGSSNFTFDGTNLSVAGNVSSAAQFIGVGGSGTSGAPSYSFTSDLSTGIFHPANNIIGFSTGGVERARLDGNGFFGIGTTTPGSLLSIGGVANFTTATSTFYSTGGINLAGGGCFAINGTCLTNNPYTFTYPLVNSANTVSLAFGTTTANSWSAAQTFNGGVTTNTLSVGSLSGVLYGNSGVVAATATSTPTLGLGINYSGTLGSFVGGSSGAFSVATSSLYTGTTGQFPYFSGTNTITATSSLFLATSGNVGIGTTSPSRPLSVQGNALFSGDLSLANLTATGTAAITGTATVGNIINNGLSANQLVYTNNSKQEVSVATSTLTTSAAFSYSGTLGTLVGGTSGTLSLATNGVALTNLAQIAANTVLANPTGAPGNVQAIATSTFFGTGTGGQVLTWNNGVPQWVATTTYANGTGISTSFANGQLTITNTGVTSITPQFGSAITGGVTVASSTTGTDFSITGSGATLTFNLPTASATNRGLLTSADWNTFNNKISSSSLSAVYPLAYNSSTGVFTTAFSTTTANTYSALQTFNGGVTIGALSGVLYGNNGSVTSTATSTATLGLGLSYSGTLGSFVGGVSGNLTVATSSLYSGTTGQFPYFSGTNTITATSALFLSGSSIGIGTTTPSAKLSVVTSGLTGIAVDVDNSNNSNWMIFTTADNQFQYAAFRVQSNSFEIANLRPNGNLLFTPSGTGGVGIGTTTPSRLLSVQGNALFSGDLSLANLTATGTATVGNLITNGVTANTLLYANGSKQLTSVTIGNGLSFTAGALSTSFGTTTANTWSAANTFTGGLTTNTLSIGSLSGVLYGNAGAITSTATSTPTLGLGISYSGTLGSFVGGSSGAFSVATSSLYTGTTGQFPYFSGTNTITATSSLFLATNGYIGIGTTSPGSLLSIGGTGTGINFSTATTTFTGVQGINLTSGCYAVNGVCLSGTSQAAGGTGAVQFANSTAFAGDAANFIWDNTNKRLGIGTSTPYATLSVLGTQPASVGSAQGQEASTTLAVLGGIGGNTTIATTGTGGTGSPLSLTGGTGGIASVAAVSATGGSGGSVTLTGGAGGDSTGVGTTRVGGNGGNLILNPGTGGAASGGTSNTAGAFGNVLIASLGGNVGIGTTSPYAKLSVAGQVVGSYFTGTSTTASTFPYASTTALTVSGGANALTIGSLAGVLYGNSGAVTSVATSSLAVSGPFVTSGTLGALVGGTNSTITYTGLATTTTLTSSQLLVSNGGAGVYGVSTTTPTFGLGLSGANIVTLSNGGAASLSIATSSLYTGTTGQFPYFSGTNTLTATSSLFLAANGNIGIGTTTPSSELHISKSERSTSLSVVNSSSATGSFVPGITIKNYDAANGANGTGAAPTLTGVYGLGTEIAPAAISSQGRDMLVLQGSGIFDTTGATRAGARIAFESAGAWSNGNYPTRLMFSTINTGTGSPGESLRIDEAGKVGIGTTTPSSLLSVQGNALFSGNLSLANLTATGTAAITGTVTVGNIINNGVSANQILYTNSSKQEVSVASSSLAVSGPFTISGTLGALIGGTNSTITWSGLATTSALTQGQLLYNTTGGNGVASVATSSATLGLGLSGTIIGVGAGQSLSVATSSLYTGSANQIPYFTSANTLGATSTLSINVGGTGLSTAPTYGQILVGNSSNGYTLTATSSLGLASAFTATYPIQYSGNVLSLAFGTTTANSWSALNTFTGGLTTNTLSIGSLSGVLYGNAGTITSTATSTPTLGLGISYSGTLGSFVGGSSGAFSVATSSLYSGTTGQFPYFSGTNTITATSSLFLATSGNVGVGSTTPNSNLVVSGSTTAASVFTIDNTSTTNYAGGSNNGLLVIKSAPSGANSGNYAINYIQGGNQRFAVQTGGQVLATGVLANAPGYSFLGDTTTGMFGGQSGSTRIVGFSVNNVESARFTDYGGFGIGTTSPRWALTVSSSTAPQLTLTDGSLTNSPFNFRAINNSFYLSTSSPSTFATSSSNLLTLNSNTGSTTLLKLDVTGLATSTFSNGLNLNNGCYAVNGTCLSSGSSLTGTQGQVAYFSGTNTAIGTSTLFLATTQNVGVGTTTPLSKLSISGGASIGTNYNFAAPTNGLIVEGNVGVGTTSPYAKLAIQSSASAQSSIAVLDSFNGGGAAIELSGFFGNRYELSVDNSGTFAIGGSGTNKFFFDAGGSFTTPSVFISANTTIPNGPSYSFAGDTDTGMYQPTVNTIAFSTNGTEKLRIDASGFVGIGTSSPYAMLSIGGGNLVIGAATAGGSIGDLFLPKLGTAAGSILAVDASGKVIATTTSAGGVASVTGTYPVISSGGANPAISLAFGTTTSNRWGGTQTFTNNVAIGTTTPTARLTIWANNGDTTLFNIASTSQNDIFNISSNGVIVARSSLNSSGTDTATASFINSYGAGAYLGQGVGGNTSVYGLFDFTGDREIISYNLATDKISLGESVLTVDATSGKVGIGTTTPYGLLSLNPSSSLGSSPAFVIGSSTATKFIITNGGNVGIGTSSPDASLAIAAGTTDTNLVNIINKSPTGNYKLQSNTILNIKSTGYFGVGTSTTSSLYTFDGGTADLGLSNSNFPGITFYAKGTDAPFILSQTGGAIKLQAGAGSLGFDDGGGGGAVDGSGGNTEIYAGDSSLNYLGGGASGNVSIAGGIGGTSGGDILLQTRPGVRNSLGSVGIGTTSPFAALSIHATPSRNQSNNPMYKSTLFAIASSTASATTTHFIVSATGRVGIATSSPGSLLSIGGSGAGINFSTATSTFTGVQGINLTSGCYAINGVCIGASGGSGTVNTGTTGQFPYYAANGTTLTATSSLFLATSGNIGIGNTSPDSALTITSATTTSFQLPRAGTMLHIVGDGINNTRLEVDTYLAGGTVGSIFQGRRANGTQNAPTAATADQVLAAFSADGYRTTGFGLTSPGGMTIRSAGTFTDTSAPTYINFFTTPSASVTSLERMRIDSVGNVGIGTTSPLARLDIAGANNDTSLLFQLSSVSSFATTTRFTVTSTGNVGIGTSSPNAMLSLYNTNTAGASPAITLGGNPNGDSDFWIGRVNNNDTIDNDSLQIGNSYTPGTSPILTIAGNGKVGIGTTTPNSALTVSTSTGPQLTLTDGTATSNPWNFRSVGGNLYIGTSSPATFATSSIPTLTLLNSGQAGLVGIGSSTPWGKFSIELGTTHPGFVVSNQGSSTPSFFIGGAQQNGYVGIGTSSPNRALTIVDSVASQIGLSDGTNTSNQWNLRSISGSFYLSTSSPAAGFATSTYPAFMINTSGGVGIGTTTSTTTLLSVGSRTYNKTQVATFASVTGVCQISPVGTALSCSSDSRLKKNIEDIGSSYDRVMALNPVMYNWNPESNTAAKHSGFIAQDVLKLFPDLISTDDSNLYTLNYAGFTTYLVSALQEVAQRQNAMSTSTITLNARVDSLTNAVAAVQQQVQIPQELAITRLNAQTISIAQGVSAGSLTTQSVNVDGTVSAARYIVPNTATVFGTGTTTITGTLPEEALTAGGSVDLYALASYALASTQALASRTDLLSVKIDDLESRLTALETLNAGGAGLGDEAEGALGFTLSSLKGALAQLGIMVENGMAKVNKLVTNQLVLEKGADGTDSTGSEMIPAGDTELTVTNRLVHTSSKIFLTFTSSREGGWYISEKEEGSFTIKLSAPQNSPVTFDYFLIQTDANAQVAGVGETTGGEEGNEGGTPPPPASQQGGPTVSLSGDAAVQIAQGAAWTDPGATATAADGTDVTASISVEGGVDLETAGFYTITYRATDAEGRYGLASRLVTVLAPTFGGGEGGGGEPAGDAGGTGDGTGETGSGGGEEVTQGDGGAGTDGTGGGV